MKRLIIAAVALGGLTFCGGETDQDPQAELEAIVGEPVGVHVSGLITECADGTIEAHRRFDGHPAEDALDAWCEASCNHPGAQYCPEGFCQCTTSSIEEEPPCWGPTALFAAVDGMDAWCQNNCTNDSSVFCPATHCQRCEKRVFVSSTTSDGDLGGVAGADATCATLASNAGLPGTYLAWIATDSSNEPLVRMTQSQTGYMLVDGTKVWNDWDHLLSSTDLFSPINLDENGDLFTGETEVWTNVDSDADVWDSDVDCSDWTSGDSEDDGNTGDANSDSDSDWTEDSTYSCDRLSHLYCFEQ